MRIGIVLDDTLDTPDGVQQYVLNVGSWLSQQGHDVQYLVGATVRTDVLNIHSLGKNVAVRFNGNRMSVPLPVSRKRLRKFMEQEHFDVIHVQVPYSPFLAGRIIRATSSDTAVLGTFHILPYSKMVRLANRFLALLNNRSSQRFDQMIAVSEPAKQFALDVYHYKNCLVIPNPIKVSQFQSLTAPISRQSSIVNIVFLGRLVERKGAQQLLKAIAFIHENKLTSRAFHVHIGGKGDLLSVLKTYVSDHGLDHSVSFDGFITEAEKANYLSVADIAVFPSSSGESFGIILLEAMAAARGVVLAGNNPGYASVMETLSDQLFDPKHTKELAMLICSYLDASGQRQARAIRQKEFVKQFDNSVVGNRILEQYDIALQRRRSS